MKKPYRIGITAFCLLVSCGVGSGEQEENAVAETALLSVLGEAERLGPEDLRIAAALYDLGSFYHAVAKPAEAEKFYLRSLAAREKILGADDPSLAETLSSLVTLYLENGLYAKAERLQHRLTAVLRVLTLGDRDTARLLHNLGALHYVQREYSKAEPLYRQALARFEKAFGPDGREGALVLNSLAMLCAKTGRYQEAISYLRRALAIWESEFGASHPNVARALSNLAGLFLAQGRHMDAEPLFQRALTMAENTLGPENPLVAGILSEYAVLLRKAKRKAEASSLEKRARAIRESQPDQDLARHTIGVTDLRSPGASRNRK